MTNQFKKLLKEKSDLTDRQFDLMFKIVSLENKIMGMKLMQTGRKGYSSHQGDTLIFNTQIELDSLIEKLDITSIGEMVQ